MEAEVKTVKKSRHKLRPRESHGMTNTPEHRTWGKMLSRCSPKYAQRRNYFDRGIKVCDEWKASFIAFLKHVGKKPSPAHSLDRINNNGNYEPGNVRWATRKEQNANRSDTVLVTIGSETKCLKHWCSDFGIEYACVLGRIRRGLPQEQWFTSERFSGRSIRRLLNGDTTSNIQHNLGAKKHG